MLQKFEQTMVDLIFDTMDLHYGIKLMKRKTSVKRKNQKNDRFHLLTFIFQYAFLIGDVLMM